MEDLTGILQEATRRIEPEFFQVPIDGGAPVYRERTYCYELYHQMRTLWPEGCPFRLNGELDKGGHPLLAEVDLATTIPDLLVHQPGSMAGNHCIIEVKTERALPGGIENDLGKLVRFRMDAGYQRAIYLVFGYDLGRVLQRIEQAVGRAPPPSAIELWAHASPGRPAEMLRLLGPQG